MPSHDLTTFTGARALADDVKDYLTEQFNRTGRLAYFLVLFMTRDPNTGLVFPNSPVATQITMVPIEIDPGTGQPTHVDPFSSPEARSAFAKAIRQTSARSGSVGLLFAHEAWLVSNTQGTPLDTSIAPSAHPNRQEVVLLSLHHYGGIALWQAPILRNWPEDGRPSLGAFTEIPLHSLTATGQFWDILPAPPQYN